MEWTGEVVKIDFGSINLNSHTQVVSIRVKLRLRPIYIPAPDQKVRRDLRMIFSGKRQVGWIASGFLEDREWLGSG